eukprot:g833.t1
MRRSTVAYASPASEDNLGKDNVTGDGQNDNFGGWTEKFQEGILPVRKNSRRKKDSAAALGKEKPAKKDDVGREQEGETSDKDLIGELQNYYAPDQSQITEKNMHLFTPKALLMRESLRFEGKIVQILRELWEATDKDSNRRITKGEYFDLYERLYKRIIGVMDKRKQQKYMEKEWDVDRNGHGYLDSKRFHRAIFQLADIWTHKISVNEYAEFLQDLLDGVTELDRHGRRVLLPVSLIVSRKDAKRRKRQFIAVMESSERQWLRQMMELYDRKNHRFNWSKDIAKLLGLKPDKPLSSMKLSEVALREIERVGGEILKKGKLHHQRRQSHLWSQMTDDATETLRKAQLKERKSSYKNAAKKMNRVDKSSSEKPNVPERESVRVKAAAAEDDVPFSAGSTLDTTTVIAVKSPEISTLQSTKAKSLVQEPTTDTEEVAAVPEKQEIVIAKSEDILQNAKHRSLLLRRIKVDKKRSSKNVSVKSLEELRRLSESEKKIQEAVATVFGKTISQSEKKKIVNRVKQVAPLHVSDATNSDFHIDPDQVLLDIVLDASRPDDDVIEDIVFEEEHHNFEKISPSQRNLAKKKGVKLSTFPEFPMVLASPSPSSIEKGEREHDDSMVETLTTSPRTRFSFSFGDEMAVPQRHKVDMRIQIPQPTHHRRRKSHHGVLMPAIETCESVCSCGVGVLGRGNQKYTSPVKRKLSRFEAESVHKAILWMANSGLEGSPEKQNGRKRTLSLRRRIKQLLKEAPPEKIERYISSAKKDQGIYHMLLRYLAATSCCADRSELLHDCATFYHSQFAQVTSAVLQENADLHMKLQKAKADAVKNYGKVRNFIGRVSGNSSAKLRRKAFEEWKKSCIHRKQHMETLQKVLGSSTKRSLMLRHFSMWKDAIESWRKVRGVASASKMILDQRNTLEVLLNQAREALQQEKAANQQANEYSQHLLSKIDEMHAEETAREASLKNALVDIEKSVVCDAPPLRGGLGAFEHALATNAAILDHIEAAKTTSTDAACQTTATVRNIRSRHGSRRGKRRKKKSKAGGPLPSSSNMKNERGEASAEEQVSFGSLVDMERAHLEQILTDFQNSSPCFHGSRLEAGDLAAIADKCEIRSFSENDLLYSEAEEAAWFGFVFGGTLQRTGLFDSDQEITPGTVILEEGVIAGKLQKMIWKKESRDKRYSKAYTRNEKTTKIV